MSQRILELPLGTDAHYISHYYEALSLNRQGPEAYPRSNKILVEVADHGSPLFRSKAYVALATNLLIAGDRDSALDLYAGAAKIAGSCESGGLHPVFFACVQLAVVKINNDGDHGGALSDLLALWPLAWQIRRELPAVFHFYLNVVAVALLAVGRPEEAARLCQPALDSPFGEVYPEFRHTAADIELALRKPSRLFITIGKPFTGAEDERPDVNAGTLADASRLAIATDSANEADAPVQAVAPAVTVEPVRLVALVIVIRRAKPVRQSQPIFLRTTSIIRLVTQLARLGTTKRNPARLGHFHWSYGHCHSACPRAP